MIWFRDLNPSSRTVIQWNLYKFQPSNFLVRNNITVPLQKGIRWFGWLTADKTSFPNDSVTSLNDSVDKSILDAEFNACVIIATIIIEINIDNDYIHVLNDLPKQYIYGYLISKLTSSQAKNQNTIWHTISLLLIWGDVQEIRIKGDNIIGLTNYYLAPKTR